MLRKIVIFEDDFRLSSAISEILSTANYRIVGNYDSYEQYKESEDNSLSFDIALVDVNLNGIMGTEIISKLKARNPFLKIIMLSNESSTNSVYNAFINGADGYLLKIDALSNLGSYLAQVEGSSIVVSNSILTKLISIIRQGAAPKQINNKAGVILTKTQRRVYIELLKGLTYEEIGKTLNISSHTVSIHVQKIYRAHNVKSRNELYQYR